MILEIIVSETFLSKMFLIHYSQYNKHWIVYYIVSSELRFWTIVILHSHWQVTHNCNFSSIISIVELLTESSVHTMDTIEGILNGTT